MRLELPRAVLADGLKCHVISQSQFNEAAAMTGQAAAVQLKDDEALYTTIKMHDGYYDEEMTALKEQTEVHFSVNGVSYTRKIADVREDKIANAYAVATVLVVSDNTYAQVLSDAGDNIAYLRGFILDDAIGREDMAHAIDRVVPGELDGENGLIETGLDVDRDFEAYIFRYRNAFSSLGVAVFIAFFVGIMFLVVTGSVLYYKQMAESENDAQRYRILSNIGMSRKQISASVAIQLGLIFGVPFIFGTIDALFALRMLNSIIPQQLMLRAIMMIIIYAVMYSVYYVVTWKNYKKKVLA